MNDEIDELRLKNDELSDFFENACVPFRRVNGNGIIIWANQAELDLLGYTQEEYIGHSMRDFHADPKAMEEIYVRLLNNETIQDFPARLRCKDGTFKHVEISSNALFVDGRFIHSRCITKDVTKAVENEARWIEQEERKNKILQLLKKSEERLRLAIAATDLGTWDWDFDTSKVYFSSEAKQILGLSYDESSIFGVLKQIHPKDLTVIEEVMHQLQNTTSDKHFNFTCRVVKPEHKILWIEVRGIALLEGNTKINRIIGSVLDVTERKTAEVNNAQLVAIVNCSNDAIVGKTLDGIVTSWNHAAEQIFGYSAAEMIGQPILKIIPEERHAEEEYILQRMRAGESIKHFETKRITKSGKLIDVSLTISPISAGGKVTGVSKIARDITAKKQEERKKNDFVSMVSHELKTPLTSILLSAQVMQKMSSQSHDTMGMKMASKIENHANRMIAMIRDFLSLARIEESKIQLRKEHFQVGQMMQEVKEEAELMARNHEIHVLCEPASTIFADRDKIGQVLNNLVSNAIKYSPKGGRVTIGCEQVDGALRIYVQDEGVGISPADQQKLFERFYRVENETVTSISGFGIGLYIVAEILKYHGTKIEVESEPGQGSVFSFKLPQAQG